MWKRETHGQHDAPRERTTPAAPGRELLMLALQELAGSARGVIYDVPVAQRPERVAFNSMRVRGSAAWEEYLRIRRRMDDSLLTLVVALRTMDDAERRLVIDWGTTYANAFLLIEPRDEQCDLLDPANPFARRVAAALAATPTLDADPPPGWTRSTPLGSLLRDLFGKWVYWPSPAPERQAEEVPLDLHGHSDTIALRLLREIPNRFPQRRFDNTIAFLHHWERELFGGPVPRARSAFQTRLGLPILQDPYCADRALRQLVNQGKVTVVTPGRPHRSFGYGAPVPDELPDEEFERLEML